MDNAPLMTIKMLPVIAAMAIGTSKRIAERITPTMMMAAIGALLNLGFSWASILSTTKSLSEARVLNLTCSP